MKYLPLNSVSPGHAGYQQQVKEGNIKRIFDLVRSGKCKSRAELVRMMNLSATSVSVLVEELSFRGLIDEIGPTQTSLPGRRPISLRLNSAAHQIVVFTLQRGGVRYTLLDLDCKIIESRSFSLDFSQLPEAEVADRFIALLKDILDRQAKRYDPQRALLLGLCFPGIYMKDERLLSMRSPLGIALSEDAVLRLRDAVKLPVYLLNDTMSLAYAEKKQLDRANPDDPETRDLLYVEVRDSVTSAIISGGEIYAGPYNISGQIGHFTIDYQGRPCPCGNTGCLERYVNLNAILDDAQQACRDAGREAPRDFNELAQRYPDEPMLKASVMQSAKLLAFGLYSLLCSSGMRRIVLGGGIEALGGPFLQEIYHALCTRSLLVHHLDISYAQAGEDAESIGIAMHYLDKVYTITT